MSANQKKRGENMLSVIIPAYNEEKMIQTTADTVDRILSEASVPYEIVFVNDGSKDGTWQQIETAAEKNPHVNGLHFSRNFGKESAIFAGLAKAEGDCCAVMDCDLQHPPTACGWLIYHPTAPSAAHNMAAICAIRFQVCKDPPKRRYSSRFLRINASVLKALTVF